MAELTLAQKKALALASARLRVQKNAAPSQKGSRSIAEGSAPSVAGLAKAAGAGVAEGVMALPGSIGDVSQLNQSLLSRGAEAMGLPEWAQQGAAMGGKLLMGPFGNMPNTSQITQAVEGVTGPLYKPQNVGEEYARTVGQFAPAALLGPGRLASKAATAGTSALLSETAGQATKGTEAEPYARLGGALLGGLNYKSPMKAALKKAPTQEQNAAKTNQLYTALDDAGVKYDSYSYDNMLTELSDDLKNFRPKKAPLSHDTLDYLNTHKGNSPSFRDMEDMRQEATAILREPNATETDKKAAGIIVEKLTKFANDSALITNGSIPADQVAPMAAQARELARRNILVRQLNEMDRKSEHYVSGKESGLKNQAASYLKSNKGKGLTKAETKALSKLTRREGLYGLLSTAGGRLNSAIAPTAAAASAFGPLGWLGALGVAGVTYGTHLGARKISEIVANNSLDKARKIILLGKEGQKAIPKRRLLTGRDAPRLGLLGSASQAGDR